MDIKLKNLNKIFEEGFNVIGDFELKFFYEGLFDSKLLNEFGNILDICISYINNLNIQEKEFLEKLLHHMRYYTEKFDKGDALYHEKLVPFLLKEKRYDDLKDFLLIDRKINTIIKLKNSIEKSLKLKKVSI